MTSFPVFYQLVVRNAADSADELVLTSSPSSANPYLSEVPSGDGEELDPIEGTVSVGAYTAMAVDADTGGGTRVVTSKLTDAIGRQQLLNRRAYIREGTDGTTFPVTLIAGYVSRLRKIGNQYQFSIASSRHIDETKTVWGSVSDQFDKIACLIGGPVRGGVPGLALVPDHGPWRVQVLEVQANSYVRLQFRSGHVRVARATVNPPGEARYFFHHVRWGIGGAQREILNALAEPYVVLDQSYAPSTHLVGTFRRLEARIEHASTGALIGKFQPLVNNVRGYLALLDGFNTLYLRWQTSQPTVGDQYRIYVYPLDVSSRAPLWVSGHPIDLTTALLTESGQPYSNSSATAMRDFLGADLVVDLRVDEEGGRKLRDALHMLSKFFGFALRRNALGEREFVRTRVRGNTTPATTITVAEVLEPDSDIFDLDEETIVTKIVVRQRAWQLHFGSGGPDTELPLDLIGPIPDYASEVTGDVAAHGEREQLFEIPGRVRTLRTGSRVSAGAGATADPFDAIALGLKAEVEDRFGRGCQAADLPVLRGVDVRVGDEVLVNLPHMPNGNVLGGARIVQVVRRTDTPAGPELRVLDSGPDQQLTIPPIFTLAKSATRPRNVAVASLTNRASLIAADVEFLRVEWAFDSTTPTSGTLLTHLPTALPSSDTLTLPAVSAHATGRIVAVRMQAWTKTMRATAFTGWVSVTLDPLAAPTSLTAVAVTGDGSAEDLAWTLGSGMSGLPLILRVRPTSETVFTRVERLPAGTTKHRVRGLTPNTEYEAQVLHQEDAPFVGESAAAAVTFTTANATATLQPPTLPSAFTGRFTVLGVLLDGTFGLEVSAAEIPGTVEVEVAVETSAGSGTPGTYAVAGQVDSALDGRTRFVNPAPAPRDGLRRYLRARHVETGKTASSYTDEVSVDPYSAQGPSIKSKVTVTATPVAAATPRIDVSVSVSARGIIRLYRKAGSAASTLDTLVATSAADAATLNHQDTGLTASTTYHYLAVCTVVATGVASDKAASARASAVFPSAGSSGHVDSVQLSGPAIDNLPAEEAEDLFVDLSYGDAASGDVVKVLCSTDGSGFDERDSFAALTGASQSTQRTISMALLSQGDLFVKVELRTSGGAVLSAQTAQANCFYRGTP